MSLPNNQSNCKMLYTIDKIKEIISPIARQYDLKCVWLFGSYARGEATPDSDLDFRVEPNDDCCLLKYARLWLALEEAFGVKVDLVSSGEEEDNYLDKKFLAHISKEEVVIYEHKS